MARGKFTVVSSLARTESLLVLLQTGFRHQVRGPNASTKVEPANDRPSPRSVLIQMSTQLVVSNHRADFRRQRQGHSHSKPKNLFSCYLSVEQFLCWEGPRKLPR